MQWTAKDQKLFIDFGNYLLHNKQYTIEFVLEQWIIEYKPPKWLPESPMNGQYKKFIEWIGSNGPYWSYDKNLGTWIGTGYGTPTTDDLWEIFLNLKQ